MRSIAKTRDPLRRPGTYRRDMTRSASCSELVAPPDLTALTLLSTFENLRRELCVRVFGNTGMFAGFEWLRLCELTTDGMAGPLHARVSVLQEFSGSMTIEYLAIAVPPDRSVAPVSPRDGMVARGTGRVMSLARRPVAPS